MTKSEVRKVYLEKRLALSENDWTTLNEQLCTRFFQDTDLDSVGILHSFLPIRKNKEPNTWLIIDRLTSEFPNVRLTVPRVNPHSGTLENYFFEGPEQLLENKWGIPEPRRGTMVPAKAIDLVLVPLLAYDSAGFRIGYGKGYYDQLLSICRQGCKKIGLSFYPPMEHRVQVEAHDQRLDCVITPEKTFFFSGDQG